MKSTFDEIRRGFLRGSGFFAAVLLGSALTYTAANVPNTFSSGQVVSASALNANFAGLQGDIDTLNAGVGSLNSSVSTLNTSVSTLNTSVAKIAPIGTILAWHKDHAGGTPALPAGWLECNGQMVSDSDSPYDGQNLPNLNSPLNAWNSRGVFLRGHSASGIFENDQLQGHRHNARQAHPFLNDVVPAGALNELAQAGVTSDPITGAHGAVRMGNETRSVNMSVVWIMRVK